VRRLRDDDELDQYQFAAAYSFNRPRDDEQASRFHQYYQREWCLGAFESRRLVAGLAIIPFEQHMLGAAIPFGGIATVASLPEYRRSGHVGALLRKALAEMRDAGQALSGLYTPHYSLYRRFGWEIADRIISYSFPPKVMKTRLPRPAGSFRRVGVECWEELAALRDEHVGTRNGALSRTKDRWNAHIFTDYLKGAHDAVIWSNSAGEPRGYAVYTLQHRQAGDRPWGETTLRVFDWVALDGEAYSAILNYLMSHDLVDQIVILTSDDEPLLAAFDEPTHVKPPPGAWTGLLLRVVDVEAAIAGRPVPAGSSDGAVTVALKDAAAPWNQATWRIESTGGRMHAEKTTTPPELELDVAALAPIYNGFVKPADAARVGQLQAVTSKAVETMGGMFATPFAPFCGDDF
jgi:predicted acetyltransferase